MVEMIANANSNPGVSLMGVVGEGVGTRDEGTSLTCLYFGKCV